MLSVLASPLGRLAGSVLLGGLLLTSAYGWGRHEGRQAGKQAQLKATVAALQERDKINADVGTLSDVALCMELGGLQHECDQLRRMDKAPTGK
jgi:hypothetical protein